jgi:hypothetical protein
MIRLCRQPSHGPTYLQALSLAAAVGVVSATPKHTVAVARPIYGVLRHDKEGYRFVLIRAKGNGTTKNLWAI